MTSISKSRRTEILDINGNVTSIHVESPFVKIQGDLPAGPQAVCINGKWFCPATEELGALYEQEFRCLP